MFNLFCSMDFPTVGAVGWKPWFHPPSFSTKQLNDPGQVMHDLSVPCCWPLAQMAAT